MLQVQQFLKEKSLFDLTKELGIRVAYHLDLPLIILNYDQIESPKTHPIIRECRALVLDSRDWSVVAKSFDRFFNWGEVAEEMSLFDFSSFMVEEKCDGSLVVIYYFENSWRINTRGSFAQDLLEFQSFTWEQGILHALGVQSLSDLDNFLDRNFTYIGEFCSPWNKIVRQYSNPVVFLLTMFSSVEEQDVTFVDTHCPKIMVRPQRYHFESIDSIQEWLQNEAETDPTFEGVVIRDIHNRRWKIKNPRYLALHSLRGNGSNVFNPKHLLPFVLNGEEDELLQYFPEVKEAFYCLKSKVKADYAELLELYLDHKDIEGQKDFALLVKDKRYSGLLFDLRKKFGPNAKSLNIKELWRSSEDQILKNTVKRHPLV